MPITEYDPPALSLPDAPFPTGVTTGPLQEKDRLATDQELADALRSLEVITHLTLDDVDASDHVRALHADLVKPQIAVHSYGEAHEFFDQGLRGTGGQRMADYLHRGLAKVGSIEHPPGSNHTEFNSWFAGMYGSAYEYCAWCAIFQCWTGAPGAIPASRRSAGAAALVSHFPDRGRKPGTLIYYTFDHVEALVKNVDASYAYTLGGNTSDNGGHTDGVWYVHRYLPGMVSAYGMPDYEIHTPPHDHLTKDGHLAITGVFGHYTINHLKRRLNHLQPKRKALPINGMFHTGTIKRLQEYLHITPTGTCHAHTVKALQKHLHQNQDGDWGPRTTEALQRRLNQNNF